MSRNSNIAAGDTISGGSVWGDSLTSAATSATGEKICCVCGEDVQGKTRYKDREGRYWCYECGTADSMKKNPVDCPDCGKPFAKSQLVSFEGAEICEECVKKRQLRAKREAARIAAAEEEARRQEVRHRIFTTAGAVAGLGMILFSIWFLFLR